MLFLFCPSCGLGGFELFGLLPVPIFIGEVLSVFFFAWLWLWASISCILWLGVALLVINS